jgi:hypothetical protein
MHQGLVQEGSMQEDLMHQGSIHEGLMQEDLAQEDLARSLATNARNERSWHQLFRPISSSIPARS